MQVCLQDNGGNAAEVPIPPTMNGQQQTESEVARCARYVDVATVRRGSMVSQATIIGNTHTCMTMVITMFMVIRMTMARDRRAPTHLA